MITLNSKSLPSEPYFVFDGANIRCVGYGEVLGGGAVPYDSNTGVAYTATAASASVYNNKLWRQTSTGVKYKKTSAGTTVGWWKCSSSPSAFSNSIYMVKAKIKYSGATTPNSNLIKVAQYNSSNQVVAQKGYYNAANRVYIGDGWYRIWAFFLTTATTTKIDVYGEENSIIEISIEDVTLCRMGISSINKLPYGKNSGTNLTGQFQIFGGASVNELDISSMPRYSGNYITIPKTCSCNLPMEANVNVISPITIIYAYRYTPETTSRGYTLCNYSTTTTPPPTTYIGGYAPLGSTENLKLVGNSITWTNAGAYDNNWRILAVTYDSSSKVCNFYVNGVLDTTSTLTTAISIPNLSFNGNGSGYPSETDVGLAITYNRALSEAEIKQIFEIYRSRYGL